MNGRKFFFFLCYKILLLGASRAIRLNTEQRLYNNLFKNHSSYGRPVLSLSSPVRAKFGIELMQLISMNERSQYIITKLWVRQFWQNELLRWNPNDFDGLDSLHVDAEDVWKPDVVLYNNADDSFNGGTEKYRTLVNIHANGTNVWLAPATFSSTCSMNVKYFPFDIQVCKLQFGSWAYDATKILLAMDDNALLSGKYINSSEWDIIRMQKQENSVKYSCCPNPYIDVTFTFVFRRRPLYFVFNVIAPCVVLMLMILFSFFLPPESGERISLTITVLLAFAVFLQVISASLPKNSDSAPILSVFYMTVMAESALSLVTTCIVLCIHHKGSEKGCLPLPSWVKRYFLDVIPREIGFNHHNLRRDNSDIYQDLYGGAIDMFKVIQQKICNECHGKRQGWTEGNNNNNNNLFPVREMPPIHDVEETMVRSLGEILEEVNKINKSIVDQENENEIAEDWKVLGKVIDRLFFYIFLITFLISAAGTLLPVYFRDDY